MPPAALVTAEGPGCAARPVPSEGMQTTRTTRCVPADRFPDGVPAPGESPAPRSGQMRSAREVCNEATHAFKRRLAASRLPLAASRLPLAASRFPLTIFTGRLGFLLGRLGPFPKGDSARHTGDSTHRGQLAEPTRRQGRQLARSSGPAGGDSLAPLGSSPLARRPRRGRLAPATRARRGRLAPAPLPCAPPLPPRSLSSGCKYVLTQRVHSHLRVFTCVHGNTSTCSVSGVNTC